MESFPVMSDTEVSNMLRKTAWQDLYFQIYTFDDVNFEPVIIYYE